MFDLTVDLVREAIFQTLLLSAPILLAGLIIGLVISILQTITQIQEQTLTYVPKIAGMLLIGMALLPWIFNVMLDYAAAVFSNGGGTAY